jgi:hypothetical protein
MRFVSAVVVLVLLPLGALAEEPPVSAVGRDARSDVALTVYNRELALVKDTREVSLPPGESTLRFEDVPAKIDPRTVVVRSLTDASLAVVEQRFAFDLASPEKLLEKYVGQEIDLVETGERLRTKVTKATLLSTAGAHVYRIGDRIAFGHPGRVVVPPAPDIFARPTLLWQIANTGKPKQRFEVSYLTGGIGWEADYVLTTSQDDARADLAAWVTITNESGVRWDDATLKLVAGEIHRARPNEPVLAKTMQMRAEAAAAPRFAEEAFDEYHLYALDRRATLRENEATQMRLFAAADVPLKKSFLVIGQPAWYRSRIGDLGRDVPVGAYLEWKNDTASHLGMPLPAGTVRVYRQDKGGATQLVGEDTIRHTPKDERVVVRTGDAFDVVATRVQTDYKKIDAEPYDVEVAFTVTLRNRKKEAVQVGLREPVGGEWKVVQSSHPSTRIDAGTIGFDVQVPAGGETAVSYRAQIGF